MKIIGNRTKGTIAVVVVVQLLKYFGIVDEAHAQAATEFLTAIAAYFLADKVQAGVEAKPGGDPRVI